MIPDWQMARSCRLSGRGGCAKCFQGMKRRFSEFLPGASSAVVLAVLSSAVFLAGCGKEGVETAQSGTAPAPVRGEPIRGEPIVAPVVAATSQVAAVTVQVQVPKAGEAPGILSNAVAAPMPSTGAVSVAAVEATLNAVAAPGASNGVVALAAAAAAGKPGDPMSVGFDKLASFQYTLPDGPVDTNVVAATQASAQIPETIKALNNRLISLKGFMLPLKVEKGLVTELLIMRDQSMCCYGSVPKINEWVSVKMVGTGVKPVMDQAVTLFGKLKVGEMYENGYLVGIYALDGERMAGPLDL